MSDTPMDPKRKTVLQLSAVILTMGTLAWASVPLYDLFCRVTGWGGATDIADAAPGAIDEEVTVRFDASNAAGMPWEFKPVELKQRIRIGDEGLAFYEAYNPTNRTIAGTASFNVAPYSAGAYFSKIQCFCFEMQVLEPGQRVSMPVSYFVEPEILEDADARFVKTITLSYTFHETDLPEGYATEQAALETTDSTTDLN
ncbi:MAG: cytochrome c oxidase assembly protein [Pseudomonadota bacterium]